MAALAIETFPLHRIAIATLVLVLHAVLISLLLRATLSHAPPPASQREQLYWLTLQAKPRVQTGPGTKTQKLPLKHLRAHAVSGVAAPALPDYRSSVFPPSPSGADLKGLHLFLFDCSLENQANLSPEQRAQCAQAEKKPDDYADLLGTRPRQRLRFGRYAGLCRQAGRDARAQ
jgi:hypothetical protein